MTIYGFVSKHLVLAALLVSGLWFYGGHQYLTMGKNILAFSWQLIAVPVLIAFCVNAVLAKGWLGLAIAVTDSVVLRDYALRTSAGWNPFLGWMRSNQYVWSLRAIGVVALAGLVLVIAGFLRSAL